MDDTRSVEGRPAAFETRAQRSRGVVLYVEDDDDSRVPTGMLLRTAGLEVYDASSADAALSQSEFLRGKLDVLIVDYHLGGELTGTELAEALARNLGHGVPTIILTGDPANAEIPWLRNSPVWLVRKPASPVTLIAGIWPLVAFCRAMRRLPCA